MNSIRYPMYAEQRPMGDSLLGQRLYRFTRSERRMSIEDLGGFAFVPLIGKYGEPESRTERGAGS